MPKNINVFIGLEVQDMNFTHGHSPEFNPREKGCCIDFENKRIWVPSGNYRKMPENDLHPVKLSKEIRDVVNHAFEDESVNISTHSMHTINILADMVVEGLINHSTIMIYGLDNKNESVEFTATIDELGYLVDWPAGFLTVS